MITSMHISPKRQHSTRTPIYKPAIEWKLSSEGLMLSVEVPGIQAKDLDIEVSENTVKLQWTRQQDRTSVALHGELQYGQFRRVLSLPFPVDGDRTKAHLHNGILTLTLPKQTKAQPIKVTLKNTSNPQPQTITSAKTANVDNIEVDNIENDLWAA